MSCCNGKCGCGSSCSCGSSCNGCGYTADLSYENDSTTTQTIVMGVAPKNTFFDDGEMGMPAEHDGCKCGSDCKCDPCSCK